MAEAVEAGARGEDTAATLRLSGADYSEDVGATQALPRTEYSVRGDPTLVAPMPVRERTPPPRRAAARAPERRRRSGSRAGGVLLALLVLAAGVAAAFAVVSASDGGGVDVPNETDVRSQAQELKDLIREYAE